MSATRIRRAFAAPFVVTIAALPACGGKPTPAPVVTPVATTPVDAAPEDAALVVSTPPGPSEIVDVGPSPSTEPIYRNPPPPQHKATRDLKWKITRIGTGEAAKCQAQQIETCKGCKPPVENHLCVYESSSTAPAERKKYPLFVQQKQGEEGCFIVGSDPAEQTYCPDEWPLPAKK